VRHCLFRTKRFDRHTNVKLEDFQEKALVLPFWAWRPYIAAGWDSNFQFKTSIVLIVISDTPVLDRYKRYFKLVSCT
jgi:hypothetical protein